MNGLEFSKATTAGGFSRALVHAAPSHAEFEIRDSLGALVAYGELEREGEYSPMTLVELGSGALRRSEVWPDESYYGLPVLLSGGEVGILQHWEHATDHRWWRWSVEFANHRGRPEDWSPKDQQIQR